MMMAQRAATAGPACGRAGAVRRLAPAPAPRPLRGASLLARADADPDTASKPSVPDAAPSRSGSAPSSSSSSAATPVRRPSASAASGTSSVEEGEFSFGEFLRSDLPKKLGLLAGLIVLSRLGVYIRVPGVDVDAFAESMSSSGLMSYMDALAGGSLSKVGIFSLGIIPYINSSIVLQLLSAAFPQLKKMQREDGPQGRAKFQWYQKASAFVFAIVQARARRAGERVGGGGSGDQISVRGPALSKQPPVPP